MGRLYGKEPFQPSRIIARILATILVFEGTAIVLAAAGMLLISQHVTFLAVFRSDEYTAFSGRGWVVIFSHLLGAFASAAAFPFIVERAKKALDFAFTLHFVHAVVCASCDVRLLSNGAWWLVATLAFIITAALGEYLCLRREMADISVEDIMKRRKRTAAAPSRSRIAETPASSAAVTSPSHGGGATASAEPEWFPLARPLRGIFRSRYTRVPQDDPSAAASAPTVAQDSSAIRVGPLMPVQGVTASPGDAPQPLKVPPPHAGGSSWWHTSPVAAAADVAAPDAAPAARAVAARLLQLEPVEDSREAQALLRPSQHASVTGVVESTSNSSLDTLSRAISDSSLDAVAAATRSRVHTVSPAPQPGALLQRSVDLPATTPRHILFPMDAPPATPGKPPTVSVPPTPQAGAGFRQRLPASGLVTRRVVAAAAAPSSTVAAAAVYTTGVATTTTARHESTVSTGAHVRAASANARRTAL